MMASDHKVGTILRFISGVGIGAKVALLFAPKAGESNELITSWN
jgi:gas vesicle protein